MDHLAHQVAWEANGGLETEVTAGRLEVGEVVGTIVVETGGWAVDAVDRLGAGRRPEVRRQRELSHWKRGRSRGHCGIPARPNLRELAPWQPR